MTENKLKIEFRKANKNLLIVSWIIGGLVGYILGYTSGLSTMVDWCLDAGIRLLQIEDIDASSEIIKAILRRYI